MKVTKVNVKGDYTPLTYHASCLIGDYYVMTGGCSDMNCW